MEKAAISTEKLRGGAAVTIASMDEVSRSNIGRSTYDFVRRAMRNPEYRKLIEARVAELEAAGKFT